MDTANTTSFLAEQSFPFSPLEEPAELAHYPDTLVDTSTSALESVLSKAAKKGKLPSLLVSALELCYEKSLFDWPLIRAHLLG